MSGQLRSHRLFVKAFLGPNAAVCVGLAWLVVAGRSVRAEDWPTYAHDTARSGITSDKVRLPLSQSWVFKPRYEPQPAWGDPKPEPVEGLLELRRVHFDDVFQVAVADGAVYFGSSADNKVYCLDASTGRVRWTKITGGPVRLAPTLSGGRVFVGSDDGCAYCLSAADGSVVWKFRAAPEDQRVLGHGKMISLWPLRTGILVDDGVAYFGAGIFPAEGVFLYALDAQTGRLIWRNDSCGEAPQSRVSPQGYLLASKTTLYAPMGRASPAAFDRRDGQLRSLTFFGKEIGGTYALLAGNYVYTGTEELVGYAEELSRERASLKDRFATFGGRKLVVTDALAYLATGTQLLALDRQAYPAASQKVDALRAKKVELEKPLKAAKKQSRQLEADISRLKTELGQMEQQTPAPAGRGKAAPQKSQRDALRSELAEKNKSLEACKQEYGKQEPQVSAMAAEIKKARRELDALVRWKTPCDCDQSLILAGNTLLAGGSGQVIGVDAASGKTLWTGKVQGSAKGLAAAAGRLLVSTDAGLIYGFGPERSPQAGTVVEPVDPSPYAGPKSSSQLERASETILRETGVRRGYCLVLGFQTGQLALELAKRSELTIYAVSPDAEKVAAAQQAIDAAGLYGARICVEQWPLGRVPYADYFANLIVSESAMLSGQLPDDPAEMFRMLKPVGGVAFLGQPAEAAGAAEPLSADKLRRWLERSKLEGGQLVARQGTWVKIVRGPLAGAGSWTHLYGDPGNTACGDDQLVRCPLGVLWFGHPGPGSMVSRHARAAGPVSIDGRLFCEGENCLMAYDAYNGLKLWERKIEGAMRVNASHDGGNLAANQESLFVAVGDKCLRLDPATGQTVASYDLPPASDGKPRRWGYVACVGKLLYGSRAEGAATHSDCLFAIDTQTGKQRWIYQGKQIPHNTIAIGDGRVFLADSNVTAQQRQQAVQRQQQRIKDLPELQRDAAEKALASPDVRLVVALDAQTGRTRWREPVDLTHCGGSNLSAMYHHGVLVIFGVYLDGHLWQEFFAGEFASRRVTALAGEDGKFLWSQPVGYRVRPMIVGDTLHAEPWAFDLRSGQPKTRIHPVTGETDRWQFARPGHHCGCPNASTNCLFFRSYCLGYYDLVADSGTMHFGAQRPGCWINFIPAGGLLLVPEASAGCMCPFPNMCSAVFIPTNKTKGFAYYSAAGPMTPVRHLAINLGAPGDRRDAAGNLWLGYPRPSGWLVLPLQIDTSFYPGGSFVARSSSYTPIAGTDDPWLFSSAARGLMKCAIPLADQADGTALYRVHLALADPDNDRPGQRVFDVKLQGKVVLEKLDIAKESGGRDRAMLKQFSGIEVADKLVVELLPGTTNPTPEQLPILQGIEVTRERVVSLGCVVPRFLLSSLKPKQSGELQLANFQEKPFQGTLQIASPPGLEISPKQTQVKLASGQRTTVPMTVAIGETVPAGSYTVPVKLVRADGSTELDRSVVVEHLGRRGRSVFPAVEDASVSQRYPDLNKGSATVLMVDGGQEKMGDLAHALAYLKFRLEIPGRPLSARLRIHNAGNSSRDAGRVCLVTEPWSENRITYNTRPKTGPELGRLGQVAENEVVECPLAVDLQGKSELSLVIDPTSTDGIDYLSRESGKPAELVVEYESK